MPRRAYIEDLQQAIESFAHPNVAEIRPGVEDGSLTFNYALSEHEVPDTTIHALVTGQSSITTETLDANRGIQTWATTLPRTCT